MRIEAANLRLADTVRLAGDGEREITKIEKNGDVRVWFRGDDPDEPPNRVLALGEVMEIQRPGDLFAAPKPPKTVEEARELIFKHMAALGWVVTRRRFGRANDYVTDPTDTVRLKLKSQALALQMRWLDRGKWPWNSNPKSLGPIKEFAANIDEEAARLMRTARARAEKRFAHDQAAIAATAKPAPSGDTDEPRAAVDVDTVVIRYSYAGGVLLGGSTKAHKDEIKALRVPYRFRYSRNLPDDAAWYVQRTRGTLQPRARIEQLANALRARGVPVVVEYTQPEKIEPDDIAELERERQNRASARVDRHEATAERQRERAAASYESSRAAVAGIEPGQPILVGHHSEDRHRRDLERSHRAMDASVEATRAATSADDRAAAAQRTAEGPTAGQHLRRIERLEAQRRDRERWAENWRSQGATQQAREVELEIAEIDAEIEYARREVKQSGAHVYGPADFEVGQAWLLRGDPATVKRINKKTVTFEPGPEVRDDIRHMDLWKVPYSELGDLRSLRRDPRSSPSPSPSPSPSSPSPSSSSPSPSPKIGRPPNNDKRAERLREFADKLEAKANAEIGAERQENTARRASMAENIRDRARRQLVIAQTLRRAADVVETGEFEYVARITSVAEVEALDEALLRGAWAHDRKLQRSPDYKRDPEPADIDHAKFRRAGATPLALTDAVDASKGISGIGSARTKISALAKRRADVVEIDGADFDALRAVIKGIRADKSRQLPWSVRGLLEEVQRVDRLGRLGITDTATLRAALREYMTCCRGVVKKQREDPKLVIKRGLQFANIPGYFPTPRALAERVVEAAQIQPGMRVLEPSAGSGAIAEVIRERHPHVRLDLVERQSTLREVLQADGFVLAGVDFMQFQPAHAYDRILMNPPFEHRQDVEHIERALGMLAPGGRVVAIAAAGLASRDDTATKRLRGQIQEFGGRIDALPADSFKESGTAANTVLIVVDKPREPVRAVVSAPPKPREKSMEKQPKSSLAELWDAHLKNFDWYGASRWENLPKTSCFVRRKGEITVTLCPAIQKHAIGHCQPSDAGTKAKSKQLMLCQVDEEVEYFRGQTAGAQEASAEADNRLVRGRRRSVEGVDHLPPLPAIDDLEGQERYLDVLAPTRIVYERGSPFKPIVVKLGPPVIVTSDGEETSILQWHDPIPADATLQMRVIAPGNQPLLEFMDRLRSGELIPYRGNAAESTLRKVVALVGSSELSALEKGGGSLHDVQFGRLGGRSVYWLRTPDGSKTYGPVTAAGQPVTDQGLLAEFLQQHEGDAQPLPTLPPGWTLANTIVVALLLGRGRRWWGAWQPSTTLFVYKGEGDDWAEPKEVPTRAEWKAEGGFADLMHSMAATITDALKDAPKKVRFRVAGPWLGVLFPSDYGKRVQFDPPTGGELDLEEIERAYAEYLELADANPDNEVLARWVKLAPRRIVWAKQWLRNKATTDRKAARGSKAKREDRDMSAKKTKKKSVGKPKVPTTVVPTPTARATPEKAPTTATSKQTTKKAAAKKAATKQKAAAKRKATAKKKAATKQKAATKKKAAAKQKATTKKKAATTQNTTKKKAATAKNPTSKKPETPKPSAEKSTADATPATDATPAKKKQLHFKRNDIVRFRKRSRIAVGLGVSLDTEFKVEMVSTDEGRPVVVLRFGQGKHSALLKVAPGHLAIVERGLDLPAEIRSCAAKLSQYKGPISPKTRRLMAELARRS